MQKNLNQIRRSLVIPLNKASIRKHYRKLCHEVSLIQRESAGGSAAAIFSATQIFKVSDRISCYLSYKHEFNTSYVIEAIWTAEKKCYVPIISKKEEKYLHFTEYKYGDPLHPNKYLILEPLKIKNEISPNELDIVIVPLTAFTNTGIRLGAGGGYYDRTFDFLKNTANKKPLLIGLGYHFQESDNLPADDWDVHLDGILTDQYFKAISRKLDFLG